MEWVRRRGRFCGVLQCLVQLGDLDVRGKEGAISEDGDSIGMVRGARWEMMRVEARENYGERNAGFHCFILCLS